MKRVRFALRKGRESIHAPTSEQAKVEHAEEGKLTLGRETVALPVQFDPDVVMVIAI